MKTLLAPKPQDGGLAAPKQSEGGSTPSTKSTSSTESTPTSESLQAENAALRAQLLALQATETQRLQDEDEIAKKTAVGLSRAQAIAVIKRQRDFDAARAKEKETRLGKIAVLIKSGLKDQDLLAAVRALTPAASHSVIASEIQEARKQVDSK